MPKYLIRDISAALWARVKARAEREAAPGQPWRLDVIILQLLDLYARLGLPELLRRVSDAPPSGDGTRDAPDPAAGPRGPAP